MFIYYHYDPHFGLFYIICYILCHHHSILTVQFSLINGDGFVVSTCKDKRCMNCDVPLEYTLKMLGNALKIRYLDCRATFVICLIRCPVVAMITLVLQLT